MTDTHTHTHTHLQAEEQSESYASSLSQKLQRASETTHRLHLERTRTAHAYCNSRSHYSNLAAQHARQSADALDAQRAAARAAAAAQQRVLEEQLEEAAARAAAAAAAREQRRQSALQRTLAAAHLQAANTQVLRPHALH
jgi:hypothetical protein